MENNNYFDEQFSEDMDIPSKKFNITDPVGFYGDLAFKNMARIIKFIAYLVAILNLGVGLLIAFLIYKNLSKFIAVAFGVVLVFAIFSAIFFFLIYAIGRVLEQNNYIIEKLE